MMALRSPARTTICGWVCTLSGVLACTDSAVPEGTVGAADADVTVVREDVRIGTASGDGPTSFSVVPAIAVDPLDRLYVLDGVAQEVRVFDAMGQFVRRIGRKGSGPKEFTGAIGLEWDPHDRLWIVDQENVRYTVVDTAGTLVAEHRRPIAGSAVFSWKGRVDASGNIYEYYQPPGLGQELLLRYDSTLSAADTFPLPRSETGFFELERATLRVQARIPFSPAIRWVLDRRGFLWYGDNRRYHLVKVALTGETLAEVAREFDAVAVTGPERDSAVAALQWFTKQGGRVDVSQIPDRKPAFSSIVVDDRGNLWVMPIVERPANGHILDVFNPAGVFLRRIRTSFSITPYSVVVIRGQTIYASTFDQDGVTYIVWGKVPDSSGE